MLIWEMNHQHSEERSERRCPNKSANANCVVKGLEHQTLPAGIRKKGKQREDDWEELRRRSGEELWRKRGGTSQKKGGKLRKKRGRDLAAR
eukprot:6201149-Pleurochrysis_carterae.AAC.2